MNHSAIHQKLTQQCKSTILQLKINKNLFSLSCILCQKQSYPHRLGLDLVETKTQNKNLFPSHLEIWAECPSLGYCPMVSEPVPSHPVALPCRASVFKLFSWFKMKLCPACAYILLQSLDT